MMIYSCCSQFSVKHNTAEKDPLLAVGNLLFLAWLTSFKKKLHIHTGFVVSVIIGGFLGHYWFYR